MTYLLTFGLYGGILVVASLNKSAPTVVRRRVSIGAILCLLGMLGSAVLQSWMSRTLPAAQFGRAVLAVGIVRTTIHLTGIGLIASAAFLDRSPERLQPQDGTELFSPQDPSDNPYRAM
jgi:uncharacterized membrane protein YedE/YeeE